MPRLPIARTVLGLSALAAAAVFASPAAAEPAAGEVTEVTLYRGQAQVTRTVTVKGDAGPVEVVVGPLPANIQGDSLFAEGDERVQVRAVRHRTQAVGEEPREEIRKLDEEMQDIQRRVREIDQVQELINKNLRSLDRMDALLGPAGITEAKEGKLELSAEAITQLTTYTFDKRTELLNKRLEAEEVKRELNERLELLQRKRGELTRGNVQYEHHAVLFLDKQAAGDATIRLSYLVNGCGWSPAYNIRGAIGGEEVGIEYNALIQQMSGEDWTDVKLTLSTATPALSAAAPGLAAFHVSLVPGGPQVGQDFDSSRDLYNRNKQLKGELAQRQQRIVGWAGNLDNNWRMNVAANDLQLLEQYCTPAELERLKLGLPEPDEAVSLSYTLATPISLASRRDQQIVRIMRTAMPAETYYVAAPVLSEFVYREAEVRNDSDTDLLGGAVSVFLDGRFVGRTEIPTVARGQTFVVGLGSDPQLRAHRQLVDRTESTQGGNSVVEFQYRLSVENFKDQPATVRLKDRLPYARNGADLGVTLNTLETPLSDDKLYVRLERPKNILRWDIEVPAGASGEDAAVVEFGYRVAHDRNLAMVNPLAPGQQGQPANPADAALQEEYFQMEAQRAAH